MGMGSEAREQAADLERRLLTEPQRFTMMQTLRLLGIMNAVSAEDIDRFFRRQHPRRAVALARVSPRRGRLGTETRGERAGLLPRYSAILRPYSTMGALPTFYTEELLDEAREDESISRDFLDILNNHLYHMLYAANRHGDIARRTVESANRSAEFIQYCLIGQAEEELRDPSLHALAAADLLAQRSRSAIRLERYLAFVLGRDGVEVEQCVERRSSVPTAQRCSVGRRKLPRRR